MEGHSEFYRGPLQLWIVTPQESREHGGAVVITLDSHQCGPRSNLGPSVISGLSLVLVFILALGIFLLVLQVSSSTKTNISKFQLQYRSEIR